MPRKIERFLKVVYLIGFRSTHKVYIGSSARWPYRATAHRQKLHQGKHHNVYLQRAYDKLGEEPQIEVLETFTDDIAMRRGEQKWMAFYHSDDKRYGYNLVPEVVMLGTTGYHYTKKQRENLRIIGQQRFESVESRNQASEQLSRLREERPASFEAGYFTPKEYDLFDPNGNLVHIVNLCHFARQHNLDYASMQRVVKGLRIEYEGWRLDLARHDLVKKPFSIIHRSGEVVNGVGIRQFCLQRKLCYRSMTRMLRGDTKTCMGWRRLDTSEEKAFVYKGKNHILINALGEEIRVNNLAAFCRKNNLDYDTLRKGYRVESGWKLKK